MNDNRRNNRNGSALQEGRAIAPLQDRIHRCLLKQIRTSDNASLLNLPFFIDNNLQNDVSLNPFSPGLWGIDGFDAVDQLPCLDVASHPNRTRPGGLFEGAAN